MLDQHLQDDTVRLTLFKLVLSSSIHGTRLLSDVAIDLRSKTSEALSVVRDKVAELICFWLRVFFR